MSWCVARYLPVSLFSLRPATATASGGKTLLTPTAFAIKMAILSASIQHSGVAVGAQRFPVIRDLQIAVALPEQLVLVQSFAKVMRETEFKGKAEERSQWLSDQVERGRYPFGATIAYRELLQFGGPLALACASPDGTIPDWLPDTLLGINYFGKRGSFFQPMGYPELTEDLLPTYTVLTHDTMEGGSFALRGTLAMLDDCGPTMTFAHANIYEGGKSIRLGKERILRHIVLPYQLVQSSRGYSRYRYTGTEYAQ